MLKNILKVSFVFITLFCFNLDVRAYEFINFENEDRVNSEIDSIYESRKLYDEVFGITDDYDDFDLVSSDQYWWPIGSIETKTINGKVFAVGEPQSLAISDGFACGIEWRGGDGCHDALDIGGLGLPPGTINVIAAKAGRVIYPTKDSQTQFEDKGYYGNPEGGGCGNYVILEHSDGIYTMYCHMAKNSITVRAGDEVQQGEVIGKVGHSGSSTGAHLHFAVRVGSLAKENAVDPLDYIDSENPRPNDTGGFSLVSTVLTRSEFIAKMDDYCKRSGNKDFCDNFNSQAGEIYDVSLRNRVNPELVVVYAGAESSWGLDGGCKYTNNYWGIRIYNGEPCDSGGVYSTLLDGVADFANVISRYNPGGELETRIMNTYEEREAAGCDKAGHGLPGTMEGLQSLYSYIGPYRLNPGSWNDGGCVYFNGYIYDSNYCNTVPTCTTYGHNANGSIWYNCPENTKTTVCEQNDYTAYRATKHYVMRNNIFGL